MTQQTRKGWLARLFCRHEYYGTSEIRVYLNGAYTRTVKIWVCAKCGREK